MSRRRRIFLGILLVYALGTALLVYRVLADLDPRYRESAEESLVETAQLVASVVEQDVRDGHIDPTRLKATFDTAYARRFEARIFSVVKDRVDLRVYVVDARGRVLLDTRGQQAGADFSQWRDVVLALRGQYGARTTADQEGRPDTSVMHVAAPVRDASGRIVGAVSVAKPVQSFGRFVEEARRKTLVVGVVFAVGVLLLTLVVSLWLVRPFGLIAEYWRFARSRPRPGLRALARRAFVMLRGAFDEMRDALAGRDYVADYVQTLTHELKSPLSAIRGAAELLQEPDMPAAERQRFLANIGRETQRIQEVVDRMMELTALEARRGLERSERVALGALLADAVGAAQATGFARQVAVELAGPVAEVAIDGDPFLLRRAIGNLLDNAIDFSPAGGVVQVSVAYAPREVTIVVRDRGPGIPDYAQGQLFEKFYSLPRPHSGKKSTGLGLSFVRQIASLHRGRVVLANAPDGGAMATLVLPRASSG